MKTISNNALIAYITYVDCDCKLSKAAKKLGVYISSVVRHLELIERDSSLVIARRVGRREVVATEEMIEFYNAAKEILKLQKELQEVGDDSTTNDDEN